MPAIDDYKSSWADEVELDSGSLPPPTEVINGDHKVVTEYKIKDDKKIKTVRTYKISKVAVSKSAARRKTLPKFGDSAKDKAGPNPHTTMVSEDFNIQFISSKEEEKTSDALLDPTKTGFAKCRFCNGEHWSVNCPFKHTASYSDKIQDTTKPSTSVGPEASGSTKTGGKYVPPFMKDSQKMGMRGGVGRDDTSAIRISNLSESMVESDLEELVKKIGPHSKMYLARDKITGICKGFAYVHFRNRKDAASAIDILNGYGYDHLILNVEWSKPQQPQN